MNQGPITLTPCPCDEHPERVRVDGKHTTAILANRAEAAQLVGDPIWHEHARVALDHYDS